jgi:hypothetical protein
MYCTDVLRKVLNKEYKNRLTVSKFRKTTPSFVMSLLPFDCPCLHYNSTTCQLVGAFSRSFLLPSFTKTHQVNTNMVIIEQKHIIRTDLPTIMAILVRRFIMVAVDSTR